MDTPADNPKAAAPGNAPANPPQAVAPTPPAEPTPMHVIHKRKVKFVQLAIIFIFVIVSFTALLTYVKTPLSNSAFITKISDFIMALPLTPKTPEYVIRKAARESVNMKSFTFDMSLAADGVNGDMFGFGSDNLDFEVKGALDLNNPEKIQADLSVIAAKDLTFDVRLNDQITYFKINKIPSSISNMIALYGLGQSTIDKAQSRWFYFDTKPADTEARKLREKESENEPAFEKKIAEAIDQALAKGTIKLKSSIKNDTLDGKSYFLTTYIMDKAAIDSVETEMYKAISELDKTTSNKTGKYTPVLTKSVKEINTSAWVDKSTYFIEKMTISFKLIQSDYANSSQYNSGMMTSPAPLALLPSALKETEVPITMVIRYKDINKPVKIEIPAKSMSFDDFTQEIFRDMQSSTSAGILNPVSALASANDAKVQQDVINVAKAAEAYSALNNGLYPSGDYETVTSTLVKSADLRSMPVAPEGYTGYVWTGNSNQFTIYAKLQSKKYADKPYFMYSSIKGKSCFTDNPYLVCQ